jgi:hypothetical protein
LTSKIVCCCASNGQACQSGTGTTGIFFYAQMFCVSFNNLTVTGLAVLMESTPSWKNMNLDMKGKNKIFE